MGVGVWMGVPTSADAALIPDTHYLDDSGWRGKPGYLHYEANYLLITGNLLDFSHLSYVHETTLGGSSKYAGIRPTITRGERSVRVESPSMRNRLTGAVVEDQTPLVAVFLAEVE